MLATFELPTAKTWSNPWPMYRALRDHDPVHHAVREDRPGEESGCYVLSRHADVWSAASDPETFSSGLAPAVNYGELKLPGFQGNPPTVAQHPQAYSEFRKLVSRGFTPGQVETLEPNVREFVVERIERLRANGGGDIVAELFKPLPSMVVADYLGVPEEDRTHFYGWTEPIIAANMAESANGLKTVAGAFTTMMGYFTELIKLRRLVPGDDTLSKLVAAGMGGGNSDIAGMLSLLAFVFAMVASGIDTTTGMLGGSRMQSRVALTELLARCPDFEVDESDIVWANSSHVRRPLSVPFRAR